MSTRSASRALFRCTLPVVLALSAASPALPHATTQANLPRTDDHFESPSDAGSFVQTRPMSLAR